MPPPTYLPSVLRSGSIPSLAESPPGCSREVITSSKISTMPRACVSSRSMARKSGLAGMPPPPPSIGSRITAARSAAFSAISCRVAVDVVVLAHHAVEGRIHRRGAMAEIERAAVIAALHRHDLLAAGEAARRGQRHHVGLGAGVGEAHQVHVEALRHHLGELHLALVVGAEVQAVVERRLRRLDDARMRVAIDAGRIFAQQVEVAVAVDVGDGRALAPSPPAAERVR